MSFIGHRCECGHPDYFHQQRDAPERCGGSYSACKCPSLNQSDESAVFPTKAFGRGDAPTPIIEPGDVWRPGSGISFTTCTCDSCRDLFAATEGIPA